MVNPKSYGGLGFKDMRLFNQALLTSQAMHLHDYLDSLCSQVLKAKYCPRVICLTWLWQVMRWLLGEQLSMESSCLSWVLFQGLGMAKVRVFGEIIGY
jgi:hypothetical protein